MTKNSDFRPLISGSPELKETDPIGTFDPLLAAVNPKGSYSFYRGGYLLWPNPRKVEAATIRIMTIGNSTSLWPDSDWSRQLGEMLVAEGYNLGIYHGAGKGNTSSQDVLRVVRDAAAIQPDLIISLSGICDIGYLLNSRGYPFAHKYVRRALGYIKDYKFANETVYGYPDSASPAEVWCRNQRIASCVAQTLGSSYLVFLQPIMGFGNYKMSPEESSLYTQKSAVVLQAINKPYGECIGSFYTEVRQIINADPQCHRNIVDFSDVFAEFNGAYRDHRHQSPAGVAHLAQQMFSLINQRLKNLLKIRGENDDV